ncbi:SHOCT domain-containing protein [Mycobacteroides abscessus]|uniref:SHOCT domain-containing protein n=1 Tax=Mycobacteroides abscessus TaxID=36809 RepID=UPI0013FD4EB8|nr:SHOCT domain-containing protein [Mycobacteroides abscessus]
MGIVRNSSTRILAPYESAYPAVLAAFQGAEVDVTVAGNPIVGETKRSLRKNRWAAAVTAAIRPETPTTTIVDWSVDMQGDKHGALRGEILDALELPVDDLGVGDALNRLGKMGRFFGVLEARALADYVHLDERVVELAQGVYGKNQGMLVLTTQRLFFFDKGLLGAGVEEFDFNAIGSLGFSKKLGGEAIDISISGRSAEIKQVAHGRGETFVAAYRRVRSAAAAPAQPVASAPDLADQIRKLSELRDAGILTDEEFNAKKADLLSRM